MKFIIRHAAHHEDNQRVSIIGVENLLLLERAIPRNPFPRELFSLAHFSFFLSLFFLWMDGEKRENERKAVVPVEV